MEWTACVPVLALLFQFHTRIDQIDDVGASQQVIDENAWNSSSHMPHNYTLSVELPLRWLRSFTPVTD